MVTTLTAALDVAAVRGALGVSRERLGRLLDVSAKTIERWEKGDLLPASERQRQALARLAQIAELGRLVFTDDGFRRFLLTPLPVLGGHSALAAIETGEVGSVLGLLRGLYEGEPA